MVSKGEKEMEKDKLEYKIKQTIIHNKISNNCSSSSVWHRELYWISYNAFLIKYAFSRF